MPQPTDNQTDLPHYPRGRQLTQEEIAELTEAVLAVYPAMTIRAIAAQTNRSYGTIHRLLRAGGATMAPRGGRYERRLA